MKLDPEKCSFLCLSIYCKRIVPNYLCICAQFPTLYHTQKKIKCLFQEEFEMHGFALIPADYSLSIETPLVLFLPSLCATSSSLSTCFSSSWVAHHVNLFSLAFLADNCQTAVVILSSWVLR